MFWHLLWTLQKFSRQTTLGQLLLLWQRKKNLAFLRISHVIFFPIKLELSKEAIFWCFPKIDLTCSQFWCYDVKKCRQDKEIKTKSEQLQFPSHFFSLIPLSRLSIYSAACKSAAMLLILMKTVLTVVVCQKWEIWVWCCTLGQKGLENKQRGWIKKTWTE